ncbi:hypothetical protein FIBSPDRAFT_956266 [Athelia psychrophila]|uniref:Uncharacterized protein n=1 Tax=Athelia psychrophila TaxID=1759441 RepID=A0A166H4T6_9AGAM|nr:hypothetical protein FIBSPDRAFT_956266 [Fibularhizoctonia sp. CBS 109695]
MQRAEAHAPQMARRVPPHIWPDDIPEGPATPQRASASFFTEASGNSRVVNIYGDQNNTYEGLDPTERTSLLQIMQRPERHVADLEESRGRFARDLEAHGNKDDNTITIVVNRTHLAFLETIYVLERLRKG